MKSNNILIFSGILILVLIVAFFWNRSVSEENQQKIAEQAEQIEDLEATVETLEATVQDQETLIAQKDATIAELNQTLQAEISGDSSLQDQIKLLQAELARRQQVQNALNPQDQEEQMQVIAGEKQTILRLDDQILFATGEADLKPSGIEILQKVAEMLKQVKDHEIQVEGHTDIRPILEPLQATYPTNWELSTARSTTVVRYLVEKLGMDPTRISAVGFGKFRPLNNNQKNLQKNRRVEFVLRPLVLEEN